MPVPVPMPVPVFGNMHMPMPVPVPAPSECVAASRTPTAQGAAPHATCAMTIPISSARSVGRIVPRPNE